MSRMAASLLAGLAYFACVFSAGCVLGVIRVLFVAPAVGETAAVSLELPLILAWSWLVCGWLLRRIAVPACMTGRLGMGVTAFAVLIIVELGLPVLVGGRLLADWSAQYQKAPGLIGLLGQIAFALIPLLR
jgi:hypothetical protein